MNHIDYERLMKTIDNEIEEYRRLMKKQLSDYVYENYYEIAAYEELYCYLSNYGEGLIYNGFPKKEILDYCYYQFMKTDFELTNDDLREFFYNMNIDYMKYKRKDENEM